MSTTKRIASAATIDGILTFFYATIACLFSFFFVPLGEPVSLILGSLLLLSV